VTAIGATKTATASVGKAIVPIGKAIASIGELRQTLSRKLFPPWLRRRWWVLALCLVAGLLGGYVASGSAKVMYSASAELIVESGAGPLGPGDANDANALALSDASIIPSDQATLQFVATETGTALPEVSKSVTAVAVSGTSVIDVSFKAKTESSAIEDVNAVARALSDGTPGAAIPNNSLAVVQLASSATRVGTIHSYGIPLGVILGLFIGGIAVLAIERADPRVDDVEDLARVTGTTASAFPGPLPMLELAWNIALASDGAADVTLVPLSAAEEARAEILWKYLTVGANQPTMVLNFVTSGTATDSLVADGSGPTVLVVNPNTRSRVVQAFVLRLQMLGRGPAWAVLAAGKLPPETPT
jgi:capsular polysaccharide biosynthesis protein